MASELLPVPDNLEFDPTILGLDATQRVFKRYTLRRVLGRGGMGIVWLGYDERLEREVALKFLPDAVNFDPAALDELKRETRRCLDLTHPNILRIYDFVEDEQAAAISMEYVDGQTLAALRIEKEQRVFEVDEIKKWIEKACLALHYAHDEAGVVHRDLKPANLMLTSRGQIKIADFGISQSVCDSLSRLTMRRGSSGTLAYMSPQQMGGEKSRITDDIYALGATIYELLTGKPPFYSGDVAFQVRLSIARSMKERRQEFEISGQEIPQECEDAVAACLAKIPEERPATMLELSERLGLSSSIMRTAAPSFVPTPPVEAKKPARKATPPPLPRKPFPVKRAWQIGAAAGALALVCWPLWHFLVWPFVATPGDIRLSSDPSNATVQLSGQPDRVTPAFYPHLRIGVYRMVVSKQGYEPLEQTLAINPDTELNLGTLKLKRAFGQLKLSTIPPHAHYLLIGDPDTGNFQKEGDTPDALSDLPAGTYQLTLSETGFPQSTETIRIPAHGLITEKADLIQLAVSGSVSPSGTQSDNNQAIQANRIQLINFSIRAFDEYLSHGFLSSAASQLDNLQRLGENVDVLESRLAQKRSAVETQIGEQITALLNKKKFSTSARKLAALGDMLEKQSIDRLNARFQAPLAQYQAQVDAAITATQNVPPATAYAGLKTFAAEYPDDLRVQLALAEIQTNMEPAHDRLADQLKIFRQFAQNQDDATDPNLVKLQAAFTDELKQLDALASALAAAKDGPASLQDQLERLRSQKAALERRRVRNVQDNPFAQAVNFFGKVVVGHTVVDNGFSSQEQKEDAIDAVQSRIENVKQLLAAPQVPATDAQKQYSDFLAHVPWGPDVKNSP
jgi:predicted Ser/Thr protein kinase